MHRIISYCIHSLYNFTLLAFLESICTDNKYCLGFLSLRNESTIKQEMLF